MEQVELGFRNSPAHASLLRGGGSSQCIFTMCNVQLLVELGVSSLKSFLTKIVLFITFLCSLTFCFPLPLLVDNSPQQ